MNLNQAQEAIRKISNIIQEWEKNYIESREAMELLAPLLATVISYFDLEQNSAGEKKSLYEDLEKDLDKEDGDPPIYDPDKELQEDLFSKDKKESDTEEEKNND